MEFYPCARPGRSGETTDDVPDEVVDKWASIAEAQNTGSSGRSPKTLSGSASRNRASCTWARPDLKTRSSPNGSKAPFSREPKPARARGPGL